MTSPSQVLARKYRPQVFDDLIGQEALVRTITNAIKQNRLAQAYMLTGIRGVGKTTSARIIAKGLNCIGEDGKGEMTPNPCGKCKHCQEIANDSHIDVIEIDAASNTGVDNVREIIEGAKYNPVSARYKIYIIDEVHMLSKQAFNALLKTLEEPPERVKFIFATTEIRKVPVTILSRCQRFDLKRIEAETLTKYLEEICQKEKRKFSHESLFLIAKAGDGSVRDSLSLLDQAMTQLPDNPSIEQIRQMLGVADKTALLNLYQAILKADMAEVFHLLHQQYEAGSDALTLTQDMLDLTYKITCLKVVPKTTILEGFTQAEQETLKKMAESTSMNTLTANWQLLISGIQEVRTADAPFQAIEMLSIRLAYFSDIGTPEQLLQEVKKHQVTPSSTPIPKQDASSETTRQDNPSEPAPKLLFNNVQEIVNFAREKGSRILAFNLETFLRPIKITSDTIICSFAPNTPNNFSTMLSQFLKEQTGIDWKIKIEETGGKPSLKEQKDISKLNLINEIKKDPTVMQIEKLFTGVKIEKIKPQQDTTEEQEFSDEE